MLEAVSERLAALSHQPLRAYSTFDFGRERDENARSVLVDPRQAPDLLRMIRNELPVGTLAFIGASHWYGDEKNGNRVEVVVANGASQFDILRVARSDAANFDMDTEDLVAKLHEYDALYGIDIYTAETDTVCFSWLRTPTDTQAMARSIYEFCPDIVDQGCETLDALEEILKSTNEVYLWWD
jgi:Domain of unknown function (DUF4253)